MRVPHVIVLIVILLLAGTARSAIGQIDGQKKLPRIHGRVFDHKKEALPGASVSLLSKGDVVKGARTDFDGFYSLDSLYPGKYSVLFAYVAYDSMMFVATNVSDSDVLQNVQMAKLWKPQYHEVISIYCDRRLYDIDNPTKFVIRREDFQHMPLR